MVAVLAVALALSVDSAAAQVSCGDTITGHVKLESDLVGCASPALTLTGDDVTLDLSGHSVDGDIEAGGPPGNQPEPQGGTGLAIVHGVVNGSVRVLNYNDVTLRRLRVVGGSIDVGRGTPILVKGNVVDGGVGCDRAAVEIRRNVIGGGVTAGMGCNAVVAHNTVDGGVWNLLSAVTVTGNRIRGAFRGIWTFDGIITARNNVILDSTDTGIRIDQSSPFDRAELQRNTILRSAGDGIYATGTAGTVFVVGNLTRFNGDDGIDVDTVPSTTTLTRNRASFNGDLGIEALPGVIDGGGNRAQNNGNPLQCLNVVCR